MPKLPTAQTLIFKPESGQKYIEDSKAVLAELDKILATAAFQAAEVKSAFLSYVVKTTLAQEGEYIKAYSIAVDGLGLEKKFNPQTDSRIRVLGIRLRQTLEDYYNKEGINDPIIIKLPPRSYVPVFLKNNASGADSENASGLEHSICVIISAFTFPEPDDAVQKSISLYIAEELSYGLSLFSGVSVIPVRTENDFHHGKNMSAHFILTGSILPGDRNLRIYVKLLDTRSDRQVWSQRFDNVLEFGSLGRLKDTVIRETIGVLGGIAGKLLNAQKMQPLDPVTPRSAMAFYTNLFCQAPSLALLEQIEAVLEKALIPAPLNADLHAMLAHMYYAGYYWGFFPDEKIIKQAEDHIATALLADPVNLFATLMNACKNAQSGLVFEAKSAIETVVEKNENDVFLMTVSGYCLFMMGEHERALAQIERAEKINPFMARYNQILYFQIHLGQGSYEKALICADKFYIPGFFWSHVLHAVAFGLLEHRAKAEKAAMDLLSLRPDFSANYYFYFAYFVQPAMVQLFIQGLENAGFTLPFPPVTPAPPACRV